MDKLLEHQIKYLTKYQEKKKSSKVTIDNIRRILSSFFSWLEDEDYILKSPVRRIHKVKIGTNIKETYSDEALELMRDNCTEPRDLAMIDMLASTGMRVGEMVLLNINDIDFNERECIVFGKGNKERVVYFDARTKIHLQNYLNSRTDDNPALFVSLKAPHERLKIGGIETRLREFGKQLGLHKVHPHKFRRTLATMAIDKGMPIEQLQQLFARSLEYYADKPIPHQEFEYQNHITDVLANAFNSNDKKKTPIQQLSVEYNFGSCKEIEACQLVTVIAEFAAIYGNKNKNIDKSYGSPGGYDGEVIETMEDLFLLALFEIYTNCVL